MIKLAFIVGFICSSFFVDECMESFPLSGTEQEWKFAQSNMEAASSGLVSASNELCIASVKVKAASGNLVFRCELLIHYFFICHEFVNSFVRYFFL